MVEGRRAGSEADLLRMLILGRGGKSEGERDMFVVGELRDVDEGDELVGVEVVEGLLLRGDNERRWL